MKYSVIKEEKYCVFKLEEEKLTSSLAPELKSELVKLSNEGFANIIFDLSIVKYIDSSGLSAILTGNRISKDANGTFVISSAGEYVMKLIQISKLDSILSLSPTNEEAVDAIFLNSLEKEIKKEASEE